MKSPIKLLLSGIIAVLLFSASAVRAQSLGQWDFNSSNLVQSAGANMGDLAFSDANTTSGTVFGSASVFGIPTIAGSNAIVMRFPTTTNGGGYLMTTPSNPNGGGSLLNNWTLILDLLYPSGSDAQVRPLIDTDGATFVAGPDFIINTGNAIGRTPSGPFAGTISPNTWYRVGIVVTSGQIDTYVDGAPVGSGTGSGLDGRFALSLNSFALLLGSTLNAAAPGYVNSIQFRDSALNPGQLSALGGATGGGIPITIPPVPSFIQSRAPAVGATGVSPIPTFNVVLNQGDTTITGGSIQLQLDGVTLGAVVTPTVPTYTITYTVPLANRLDALSTHTLSLIWNDSVAGNKTNSWSFNVQDYQVVALPAPFYLENFDGLSENPAGETQVPAGWSVTNRTGICNAGFNLDSLLSDSYLGWCLISSNRMISFTDLVNPNDYGSDRRNTPFIIKNGALVERLFSGNFMYAESDQRDCSTPGRGFGEYQEMYTADISCVGRSNVFVAWNSIYEQNQDNLDCLEYSVDQGTNWLPVIYYLQGSDDGQGVSDIIRFPDGSIDVFTTFSRIEANRNYNPNVSAATNYGSYIKAPVSTNLIPYIKGRTNDDQLDGKRIELVRLPAADGKPNVRFRFLNTGTGSWFWGIDDFGLYEINTPIITTQPQSKTINATQTTNFTVAATSPTPLTYQWQHAGINISNGAHFSGATTATLTVINATTNEAGSYRCIVSNNGGPVTSSSATLTVVDAPLILSQPASVLVSKGYPASFSVSAIGRPPLSYQWYQDGNPVGGATGTTLNIPSAQTSDAGAYVVVVTNITASTTSAPPAALAVFDGPVTSNLVVHLKFDNNYTDSSGRGNNATPVGSPTFSAPGKIGSHAFSYTTFRDGSSFNYATLGYPADLHFTTSSDFSVSFWMKMAPGSWSDDPPFIGNKNWDSGGNIGWIVALAGGGGNWKFNYREECPHNRQDYNALEVVTDNQWHHIAVTFQRNGVARSYLDGALMDTRTIVINPGPATTIDTDPAIADNQNCSGNGTRTANAVNIGQDGRGAYTDGGAMGVTNALIDDVGVWRRALTSQEATAIYKAGTAGQDLQQASAATLGLLQVKLVGGNVQFTWPGGPGIRLQRTISLSSPSWSDVGGTLGNSSYSEPASSFVNAYYRLYKP